MFPYVKLGRKAVCRRLPIGTRLHVPKEHVLPPYVQPAGILRTTSIAYRVVLSLDAHGMVRRGGALVDGEAISIGGMHRAERLLRGKHCWEKQEKRFQIYHDDHVRLLSFLLYAQRWMP